MSETNVYSCVATGDGADRDEKELVELDKFSREEHAVVDDLQLAALLGQTLLEKNKDLEEKLRQLQQFAEETLETNKTVSRQLEESRLALRFANENCDQLELRVDELEAQNKNYNSQCITKDATINQKNTLIESLKLQVESLTSEVDRASEMSRSSPMSDSNEDTRSVSPLSSQGKKSPTALRASVELTYSELKDLNENLTIQLQNSSYQKKKLTHQLEHLTQENAQLTESLAKMEIETSELQMKVVSLEESLLEGVDRDVVMSPRMMNQFSPPPSSRVKRYNSVDSDMSQPHQLNNTGASLFSELNTQYHTLQKKFDSLAKECRCGVGQRYHTVTESSLGSPTGLLSPLGRFSSPVHYNGFSEDVVDVDAQVQRKVSGLERPLRDLFEEVFATLQQTTQVADRLVVSSKTITH